MKARRITVALLAEGAGVDEKTVREWLRGRPPHPANRFAAAKVLGEDPDVLWQGAGRRTVPQQAGELLRLYPHRSDVPDEVWRTLLGSAEHEIGILAYAAPFLLERVGTIDLLAAKAIAGCNVRVLLADPSCPKLAERGSEEQYGEGIISRVRNALRHYQPIAGVDGVSIRLHCTTLYTSIFRFDDTIMANTHVWGRNAFAAPLLHVQRLTKDGLFDTFASSFEAVWQQAQPAEFTALETSPHDAH